MKSQVKKQTQLEKSKALFSLSNQLLTIAKKISEYHVAELKSSIAYALHYAQTAAHQDISMLKALQVTVASEAMKRMHVYQDKIKLIIDQMNQKSADKHLKVAQNVLEVWYKNTKKKIPQGAEQLGQVAHDVADSGIRAFKEGRELVNNAADAAEKILRKTAVKESNSDGKLSPSKKPVAKTPVKKLIAKKAPAKKLSTTLTKSRQKKPT